MDDVKFYLDKNALKVLASEVRIAVLKRLYERPKTVISNGHVICD